MKYYYQGAFPYNLKVFMNRLGYHEHTDRRSDQVSYIRRLGRLPYPRFHLYVESYREGMSFNVHLDEKQPTYSGYTAHSGEYDGPQVEQELSRIIQSIQVGID